MSNVECRKCLKPGTGDNRLRDVEYAHCRTGAARRPLCDPDLDVLSEIDEESHQALDREPVEAIPHEIRDVRLHDPEQVRSLGLCELAPLQGAVHLQGELDLERALFRIHVA